MKKRRLQYNELVPGMLVDWTKCLGRLSEKRFIVLIVACVPVTFEGLEPSSLRATMWRVSQNHHGMLIMAGLPTDKLMVDVGLSYDDEFEEV